MQSFVRIPVRLDIFNRIPYNTVIVIPIWRSTMKKRILWIIISLSFVLFPSPEISHATDLILSNTSTQVCFSPNGGCTESIVKEINAAKSEILVQAYSFTSAPIAKALTGRWFYSQSSVLCLSSVWAWSAGTWRICARFFLRKPKTSAMIYEITKMDSTPNFGMCGRK